MVRKINKTLGIQILMIFTEEIRTGLGHRTRNRPYVRSAATEQIFPFHCSQKKEKCPCQEITLHC